ncbi:hypothetical protein BDC45DRAFT_541309 [Circinella umbellata]|nr:hypothetical protein BDC45DRAFT_541309 [Circinella umbellata]
MSTQIYKANTKGTSDDANSDPQIAFDNWIESLDLVNVVFASPTPLQVKKRHRVTEQERLEMFHLHFDEHLQVRDVAEITGLALSTVATHIARERVRRREINNNSLK